MDKVEITKSTEVMSETISRRKAFGLRRLKNLYPPSYRVAKDLVRFGDSCVLLAASLVERVPGVQDALAATADHNHLLSNIVGGCIAAGILNTSQGYKIRVLRNYFKQLKRMSVAVLAGTAGVGMSLAITHHGNSDVAIGALRWCFLTSIGITSFRAVTSLVIRPLADSGKLALRLALIGLDDTTQTFINTAKRFRDTCNIVGIYTDHPVQQEYQGDVRVLGPVNQLLSDSQSILYDSVVISHHCNDALDQVLDLVRPVIADICLIGEPVDHKLERDKLAEFGGNLVVKLYSRPLTDWQRYQKSIFDALVGSCALVFLSPLMIFTAIAIKIDSKGPILFRQPRQGYNNKMFMVYKFRSMYIDQTDLLADRQTTRGDKRITKVGKIIRRFSIDELPQIFNVLQGTMSLVGPRPHAPGTKAGDRLFADVVKDYPLRHKVKPGITGLAQINGYRGHTPDDESIIRRVEYDLKYIENWSLLQDVKIIVLTAFREVLSKSAF